MKDLNQLNQELEQIDEQRYTLLDQIAELERIETNKVNDKYSNLIGKCFKFVQGEENCYKILKIVHINYDKKVEVKTTFCTSTEIYRYELYHKLTEVIEIPLEQFESILKQTFDNILKQ